MNLYKSTKTAESIVFLFMAILFQFSFLLFSVFYHNASLVGFLKLWLAIIVIGKGFKVVELRVIDSFTVLHVFRELPIVTFLGEFELINVIGEHGVES